MLLAATTSTAQDREGQGFDPEARERFREMMRARGGEGGRDFGRGRFGRGEEGGSEGGGERFRGGPEGGRGGFPFGGGGPGGGNPFGGGGNPFGGGEGGRGWGGGEGDGGRNWGGDGGSNGGDMGRKSSSSRSASTPKKPRERITIDLPTTFASVDADQDGQVGLYEWKRAKRTIAAFQKIDHDGDGFLTPAELARAGDAGATATAIASATPGPDGGAPKADTPAAAPPATPVALDESSPDVKKARRDFGLLDRDRNGEVSVEEWNASRQLKPLFEAAGIDLSSPMSADQFVSHYVRIKTPKS
jgi:hypothetical protein